LGAIVGNDDFEITIRKPGLAFDGSQDQMEALGPLKGRYDQLDEGVAHRAIR
jgi:hypothetical protein